MDSVSTWTRMLSITYKPVTGLDRLTRQSLGSSTAASLYLIPQESRFCHLFDRQMIYCPTLNTGGDDVSQNEGYSISILECSEVSNFFTTLQFLIADENVIRLETIDNAVDKSISTKFAIHLLFRYSNGDKFGIGVIADTYNEAILNSFRQRVPGLQYFFPRMAFWNDVEGYIYSFPGPSLGGKLSRTPLLKLDTLSTWIWIHLRFRCMCFVASSSCSSYSAAWNSSEPCSFSWAISSSSFSAVAPSSS